MARLEPPAPITVAPGPAWLRVVLTVVAGLYFAALLHHPGAGWLRPVAFFTEATGLFPHADEYATEFRLEAWPCGRRWEPLDPRPYFPIRPDDKESRFQRLGYFYERNHPVILALEAYLLARHAEGVDDGVAGPIGGIRLFKVVRRLPAVGTPVERYQFEPLSPVPLDQRREIYATPQAERKRRCSS